MARRLPSAAALAALLAVGASAEQGAIQTPAAVAIFAPVEFVKLAGGRFVMGSDEGDADARPPHDAVVRDFQISRTPVTVEQYAECVAAGRCTEPRTVSADPRPFCNWGRPGRETHPVNCVTWTQAAAFAAFKNARLPTEAEFEFAASSRGRRGPFPWGDAAPTCDRVVMYLEGEETPHGCGKGSTMPVCAKPAGNTEQGLCDMAGNVWQWVQDVYKPSYDEALEAHSKGLAFEGAGEHRVLRGNSFVALKPEAFRVHHRGRQTLDFDQGYFGFRLAR